MGHVSKGPKYPIMGCIYVYVYVYVYVYMVSILNGTSLYWGAWTLWERINLGVSREWRGRPISGYRGFGLM